MPLITWGRRRDDRLHLLGAFLTSAFGAFLLGAVTGLVLIAGCRAGRRTAVPFGPFMLVAARASILGASGLGELYLARIGM